MKGEDLLTTRLMLLIKVKSMINKVLSLYWQMHSLLIRKRSSMRPYIEEIGGKLIQVAAHNRLEWLI